MTPRKNKDIVVNIKFNNEPSKEAIKNYANKIKEILNRLDTNMKSS